MDEKKAGRPSGYTDELADRICSRLADGESLRKVCQAEDMPDKATVFRWLRTNESFCDQYTRAKMEAADSLVDEMTDIADDATNDWMEKHDSEGKCIGWQLNGDHVNRSRLRIETRKWIAAKLKPKVYGEKIEHVGEVLHREVSDEPLTPDEWSQKYAADGGVAPAGRTTKGPH